MVDEVKISKFVSWFKENITGDEKGEGQIFFERLIQAFGNEGIKEVGAICEDRVKRKGKGTGFADFVWRPRVVIELKKRGVSLHKHYDQLFEYWMNLVPGRPRYAVLCNFDEFWIYDFDVQLGDPVHIIRTEDLASEWSALTFLSPENEKPFFSNNLVDLTKVAAYKVSELYHSLVSRGVENRSAQKFVLQVVVALFSEHVNLIPRNTLRKIIQKSLDKESFQIDIKNLFEAMATPNRKDKPKGFKDIEYFNGGVFKNVYSFELNYKELDILYQASKENWSKVRPSIFGSIFESTMDQKDRHTEGAHFTSELDIQKIVYPTVIKPFVDRIRKSKTKKTLISILKDLAELKILDPACGSGNFLYVSYRELVRIEMLIEDEIFEKYKKVEQYSSNNMSFSRIDIKNFLGIDTNKFGLEVAKVSLSIGRKLAYDEYNISESVLPFYDLDNNFINEDAIFTTWPKADVIVGNPPYLGGKLIRSEKGEDYVNRLNEKFPSVKGQPDICFAWFRIAQEHNAPRVGLVSTNSISQGVTRSAGLEYILSKKGVFTDVVSTQEWSGEANVHVSIVNWVKNSKLAKGSILLDSIEVSSINSSLRSEKDFTHVNKISDNLGRSFQSCELSGSGFIISEKKAKEFLKKRKSNSKVLKKILDGTKLVKPNSIDEWVIDFNSMEIEEASLFVEPFDHVKKFVRPERLGNKEKRRKEKWWQFGRSRPKMRKALEGMNGYFCLPKVAKYTCFQFVSMEYLPCEANMVVASEDFYILGVLNSKIHKDWTHVQCSTLKGDPRYTNTTCFETFPFPECDNKVKKNIRAAMTKLENYRKLEISKRECSITELYNEFYLEETSMLFKLHTDLDKEVCKAYNWRYVKNKNYNDEIFELNKFITEESEEIITA